jgi:hypothetical protein
LAYQTPANGTFLSERISHQQPASSTFLSEQISTSYQPAANRTGCIEGGTMYGKKQRGMCLEKKLERSVIVKPSVK